MPRELNLVKVLDMPAIASREEARIPGEDYIIEAQDTAHTSKFDRYVLNIEDERLAKALRRFAQTGSSIEAAKAAECSRSALNRRRAVDPDFNRMWEEARRIAIDALEQAARGRAVDGVQEPVFYKGEVCGHVTKYSDSLLQTLLKAHIPRYRDRQTIDLNAGLQKNPEQVQVEEERMNEVLEVLSEVGAL